MADVKFFRPGSAIAVQQPPGETAVNNVLEITNQQVDASGNVVAETTTEIIDVTYNVAGEPTIQYVGDDLEFGGDDTTEIQTSTQSYTLRGGTEATPINVITWDGDPTTPVEDRQAVKTPGGLVQNTIFAGSANGLNIYNSTANGAAPLDMIERSDFDVFTITDTDYDALEMAGNVDANTLYLIRETV